MAEDIHFTIGYDNSRVRKAAKETEQVMSAAQGRINQATAGAAGGAGGAFQRNLGQVALQVQDIGVGLQGGQKAMTIVMQQGTQLLSVLGPTGMIAGGVLAVGGLIAGMTTKGAEDLAKLTSGVEDFNSQIAKAATGSDISLMIKNLDAIAAKKDEIMKNKSVDFWGRISGGLFGKSQAETSNERENQIAQQENNRDVMARAVVATENERAKIAQLIADGKQREAAELKRNSEAAKRIEEIEKSALYDNEKNAAIYAIRTALMAQQRADAKATADDEKRRADAVKAAMWNTYGRPKSEEAGRVMEAKKGMASSNLQNEMANANDLEKAELLRAAAAQARIDAMAQGPIQMSEELRLQTQINDMLARANQLEGEFAQKSHQTAQAKQEAGKKEKERIQKQVEAHKEAGKVLAANMAAKEAELGGRKREAKKIMEAEALRRRTNEIAQQLDIDPKDAADIAKHEKKIQDDLDKKAAGKIRGAKSGETKRPFEGLDGRKFGALDAFNKLQDRNTSIFDKQGPLNRNARNVVRPDPKNDKPNVAAPGVEAKIEALTKLIEARLTVAN